MISSNKVSLNGLKRACYVLKFYLANNIELREHFYKKNLRVVVLASSESLLNIPEFTHILNSNQNMFNSLRGLSPTLANPLITIGEENLLCSLNDKFKYNYLFIFYFKLFFFYINNNNYYRNDDLLFHQFTYSLFSMNGLSINQKNLLETSFKKAKQQSKQNQFRLFDLKEYLARNLDAYFSVTSNKKEEEEEDEFDSNLLNVIQQIFPCSNNYTNKCKSSRGNLKFCK